MLTATPQAPAEVDYDAAGEITYDGVNSYLYDAKGRMCAVSSTPVPGVSSMIGYVYDAEGERVGKGQITSWSCDPSANGYTPMNDYVLGLSGEELTELTANGGGSMVWKNTNVYAAGQLIATYDGAGLHFLLNDPLGTRRVQTNYAGVLEQTCASLPFGDGLNCSDSNDNPNPLHFTGKERDTESGLDYFGARYYGSSMGRFMSPDYNESGSDPDPVPYADYTNPQSLKLYSYVQNNPLTNTDSDGHLPCGGSATINITVTPNGSSESQTPDCDSAVEQFTEGVFTGIGNAFASMGNFLDRNLGNGQNQEPLRPIKGSNQQAGAMAGNLGMLFVPGPDGLDGIQLLSRDQILAQITNPKLRNIVSSLYREGATLGDGSTAAAIEHELETGEMVGGKSHSIKGRQSIDALRRALREQNLSPRERDIANSIIRRTSRILGLDGPE